MKRQERKKITSDELHDFGQTISCHELFMSIVKSAKLVGEVKDKNNNFLIMKITVKKCAWQRGRKGYRWEWSLGTIPK